MEWKVYARSKIEVTSGLERGLPFSSAGPLKTARRRSYLKAALQSALMLAT